jgi:hypothetical protein
MHSWAAVKLVGVALRPHAVNQHGLAAGGALLTCFAIVLNAVPFAKLTTREPARVKTEQSFELASISRPQVGAAAPALQTAEVMKVSEPIRPVSDPNSTPDVAVEYPEPKADTQKERVDDVQAEAIVQNGRSPDAIGHPLATIAGVWAPVPGICSARDFQRGLLPTIINTNGAWAGETICSFKKLDKIESGWKVTANCSNSRSYWTADVRLTVNDNRLIWTSKRGTQIYTRCAPDFLMTAAQ